MDTSIVSQISAAAAGEVEGPPPYQLKELSPRHRQVIALSAQGVPRELIAEAVGITPEYVTWLHRQPLVLAEMKQLEEAANAALLALAPLRTQVVADVLARGGKDEDRLKAAKIQMEATGVLGRERQREPAKHGEDRLVELSHRLVGLLEGHRGRVIEGQTTTIRSLPEPT